MEQYQSEQINDLAIALCTVQAGLTGAVKDSTNPFFNSDYADLESVWKSIRQPLADNGLCVIQTMGGTAEAPTIITTLAHTSGQWIRGELTIAPDKRTPQGIGSAITYGRRYSLAAIVGVIQVDDDAEAAMDRNKPKDTTKAGVDDIPLGGDWDEKGKELANKAKANEPVVVNPNLISVAQRNLMFAKAKKSGWPEPDVRILIGRHGFGSYDDITRDKFQSILKQLEVKFSEV